jgi:hypothetical protein
MDQATRKRYYNRCKPYESLPPEDERNVDLDRLGAQRVRGINWVERLATAVELSDQPVFELFTGLPGSGKSTELQRLAYRLGRPDGANLLAVLIQAEDVLDIANPIDIPDILTAILFSTERAVLAAEGKDVDQGMEQGYLSRFWEWLTTTDVELKGAEFAVPSGPKLVVEMKTRPNLRKRVRDTVAANLTTFLKQVSDEMVGLNQRTRDCRRAGLVVILDSLEKLRGISTNWHEVLNSAERVFAGGAPYLRLPVHVIYTIPPALVTRRFERTEFMPMIKLRDKGGNPWREGFDAARTLVRQRVPDDVLRELLGDACEERLERLIAWSGGYPREIVRLLQSVIAMPLSPLADGDFARVLNEVGDAYRKIVPAEAFDWLAQVSLDHYLTLQNDLHRQAADLMLSNNAVLRYLNDNDWFDLHPAVEKIPGVIEARRKLAEARVASNASVDGKSPSPQSV